MSNTVFLTGADGFIGSRLTEKIIDQTSYDVIALAAYNSFGLNGWLDSSIYRHHPRLEIVRGDIRDYRFISRQVKRSNIVLHLAALIGIPYSYSASQSYIETNVLGTHNLLSAALEYGVDHLITTSTSEVYGTAQYVPINEKHPLNAQSPYAATKIAADQLALSFHKSFGVPVTVLRPFNTYGPRQSPRAVIPTIIGQIISNHDVIKIGSVTPTRDFNFVDDTCDAFIHCIHNRNAIGDVFNISSDFEISISETIECIQDVMNTSLPILSEKERVRPVGSEVNRLYGDSRAFRDLTGWRPEHGLKSGFHRGIEKTVDWFKSHPESLQSASSSYCV